MVSLREFVERGCVASRVCRRRQEHLPGQVGTAALVYHQRQGGSNVASCAVTDNHDASPIEILFGPAAGHPLERRVALLEGHRVPRLGGQAVLHEDDCGAGPIGQLTDETVVGPPGPEYPSTAVDVQNHGQRAGDFARTQDAK